MTDNLLAFWLLHCIVSYLDELEGKLTLPNSQMGMEPISGLNLE